MTAVLEKEEVTFTLDDLAKIMVCIEFVLPDEAKRLEKGLMNAFGDETIQSLFLGSQDI